MLKIMFKYLMVWSMVWGISAASKVLMVFPLTNPSHSVLPDSIVRTLIDAGHEVTYITTFTNEKTRDQLRLLNISSIFNELTDSEQHSLLDLDRNSRPSLIAQGMGSEIVSRALRHPETQVLLQDPHEHFDAVIALWFHSGLLAPLAAVFECPLIWYSLEDVSWMSLHLMHDQASFADDFETTNMASSPSSSVWKRARRLWQQAYLSGWVYYMTHYVETPEYHKIFEPLVRMRWRSLPDYESVVYNGSLLLINSQPLLGQVLLVPPNVKYIGGYHIETPTKSLPKNLQRLLDMSKNGVIFVSLETNMDSKGFPESTRRALLEVLGQLEQVVLWRTRDKLNDLPGNVYTVVRAPQCSVLNHTNILMMITSGGFLSYMEAMFYGVPLINVPIHGRDSPSAALAATQGRGVALHLDDDNLPLRLKDAINEILGNYSYRSNTKQTSAIFQSHLVPPAQEILYWVELVIRSGGAMHLRTSSSRLSTLERLHLDLVALGLMLVWFLSKVVKVFKVHWKSGDDYDNKKMQ